MNIMEFVQGIDSSTPVFPEHNDRIWEALDKLGTIERMSTPVIGGIINWAVSQMKHDCAYLDIGVWHGYTFLAGMLGNDDKRCIGVDNFSQFDKPRDKFIERFDDYASPHHEFYDMDYTHYMQKVHKGPLGVYLFDGPHDYSSQVRGMKLALPYMASGCLVMVDDTDWEEPRRATEDFLFQHRDTFRLVLDCHGKTPSDPIWWNGLMVLERI